MSFELRSAFVGAALIVLVAAPALGYPGGTPDFQTDVIPYCAACHSSLSEDALLGAKGDRAAKEVAANKHLAQIRAGEKAYKDLAETDRAKLAELLQAVDANSTISMEFPPQVKPGETFSVIVKVTGGAGPVVGIALVDRPHRWYSKPASSAGWEIVGAPSIIGPKGPQTEWLNRRPEREGRNITFVNVTDIKSNAATGQWAKAKVIWTIKAPDKPGEYPLVGTYFYGTEKAAELSTTMHPIYGPQPLGGYTGKSGRIKFTKPHVITVKAE